MKAKDINIALVDDHQLFRKGMLELLDNFAGYKVVLEANNGKQLIQKIQSKPAIDIVVLDINMREMDGYETSAWLNKHHPNIKILALTMYDNESSVIKMLRSGARGYILKDSTPGDLKFALDSLVQKGFYQSDLMSKVLLNSVNTQEVEFNDREIDFLKLACTELTYKEIADKMCLSPRTIDGYREGLFEKLHVKNRVGLVVYAIKNGVFNINP